MIVTQNFAKIYIFNVNYRGFGNLFCIEKVEKCKQEKNIYILVEINKSLLIKV